MSEKPPVGRPKTKEELQAQIEQFAEKKLVPTFTEEEIKSFKAARAMTEFFGGFDGNMPESVEKKVEENEKLRDEKEKILRYGALLSSIKNVEELPETLSPDLKDTIVRYREQYSEFMKTVDREMRDFSAECIKKYDETFKPITHEIKKKVMDAGLRAEDVPEYLGSGGDANVFRIAVDGMSYALKQYSVKHEVLSSNDLIAMKLAKEVPGVPHLIAYSYDDRVMIQDLVAGRSLNKITQAECPPPTEEQIKKLLETILALHRKGVATDINAGNFMYDEKTGYSIIDYTLDTEPEGFIQRMKGLATELLARESTRGFPHVPNDFAPEVQKINTIVLKQLELLAPDVCNVYAKDIEKWRGVVERKNNNS